MAKVIEGGTENHFDWKQMRQQVPVAGRWAYFDHAAVAPLPIPARQAMEDWLEQATESGDVAWPQWAAKLESLRAVAAAMIHADPEEIALIPNTTHGVSLVAEGFRWQDGDNVVTLANEFPSNLYPWMNLAERGVETRLVPVDEGRPDLDRIAAFCDRRTRIVSISWVGYASGWRIDVDKVTRMVHERGALLFLDAIQGLGVFPLDVSRTEVDFLAADGHKWMMGPEGAGLFYVRRGMLDALRPIGVGWNSVRQRFDFDQIRLELRGDAGRFEGGSMNMAGFHGLAASLQLLRSFGVGPDSSAIGQRIVAMTDLACTRLEAAGARVISPRVDGHKSGIVVFDVPGIRPDELRKQCLAANIVLSCRGGGLRISPHAYVNEEDIERLVRVIRLQKERV